MKHQLRHLLRSSGHASLNAPRVVLVLGDALRAHRFEGSFLGSEVVVDAALADAHDIGNVLGRRSVIAEPREHLGSGRDHLDGAAFPARGPLGTGCFLRSTMLHDKVFY